jgi:flagellar basal-body rod protein FlgC
MNLIPAVGVTTSALAAERLRLEVISQNIANANTIQTPGHKTFQRQQVVFESVLQQQMAGGVVGPQRVQVGRITEDPRPPRLVPSPGHPAADANGMVAYPDINIHEEMADYIVASRVYEANLSVFRNARNMVQQTLAIGKRA